MTGENKLALVVGFALILAVGILISDHFSVARAQSTASFDRLVEDEALLAQRRSNPDLIKVAGSTPTPEGGSRAGERAAGAAAEPQLDRVIDPALTRGDDRRSVAAAASDAPRIAEHVVRPSESLTRICKAFYGTAAMVDRVAAFNGITDPDLVREGQKLRLPDASALIGGGQTGGGQIGGAPKADAAAQPGTRNAAPQQPKTYTVADGDNLSKIAARTLGSGTRYYELYTANRDQLSSPDEIRPGMTLRIPS